MSTDKDVIKSVRDFYNQAGLHFSKTRQKTYGGYSANWSVTQKYLDQLQLGQSVLDIGCGNGKLVTGLPAGVEYLGIDFSETLIREARRLHPVHQFMIVNILDQAAWAGLGTYDSIFCVAVLHHIPKRENQVNVVREIKKHLKADGFVFLTVWNLWQERMRKYHVGDHVEVPYTQDLPTGRQEWKRYCIAYELPEMMTLCADAGLTVEEIFYADRDGNKSNIQSGENLVVVAR